MFTTLWLAPRSAAWWSTRRQTGCTWWLTTAPTPRCGRAGGRAEGRCRPRAASTLPALLCQVLVPAEAPDGSGGLLGCVVDVRVLSASRWSVKAEVLRVHFRPPAAEAAAVGVAQHRSRSTPAHPAQGSSSSSTSPGPAGPGAAGDCGESCACSPAAAAAAGAGLEERSSDERAAAGAPGAAPSPGSAAGSAAFSPGQASSQGCATSSDVAGIPPIAREAAPEAASHGAAAAWSGGAVPRQQRYAQHGKGDGSSSSLADVLIMGGIVVGLAGMLLSGLLVLLQ